MEYRLLSGSGSRESSIPDDPILKPKTLIIFLPLSSATVFQLPPLHCVFEIELLEG